MIYTIGLGETRQTTYQLSGFNRPVFSVLLEETAQ